jgi:drug/metabolite transporter (DMT)-like permease
VHVTIALGLAAALALAGSAVLSKRLTLTMPARQLVGPLLLLNAVLVSPGLLFTEWTSSTTILAIHGLEAVLLAAGSWAVWDLFDHGAASASLTAQSLSPIPAVLATALLLPGAVVGWDVVGAIIVVVGLLFALVDAFPGLGGVRRWSTVVVAAATGGVMTVTSRILADLGVGIVQTYLVRTSAAALIAFALFWPRDVPFSQLPRLIVRAIVITSHFLLILAAVRTGSPAVVQALVATSPVLTLLLEGLRDRQRPATRVVVGTFAVSAGVATMALGAVI